MFLTRISSGIYLTSLSLGVFICKIMITFQRFEITHENAVHLKYQVNNGHIIVCVPVRLLPFIGLRDKHIRDPTLYLQLLINHQYGIVIG